MYDCENCLYELCGENSEVCKNCGYDVMNRRTPINMNPYQQDEVLRTAPIGTKEELLVNGIIGLCGEAGECADIVKKHLFQGHDLDEGHLAEELGDVAWYLALIAYAIGYDLNDIFQINVAKLRERYPDGFDEERSKNREVENE